VTQEFMVDVPGGRVIGDQMGDGPAVVLLHAGVADRRMWNDVAAALAVDYRVIRFDARGYGASPPSAVAFLPASDVVAVMDDLRVERAHLVGASMGGYVALDVALAHPSRVASLALLASGLPEYDFGPQVTEYWREEERLLASGDLDAVVELNLEMWLLGTGRGWTPRLESVAAKLRDQLRIIAMNQASGEDLGELARPLTRDTLGTLRVPTLVVVGENDPGDLVHISESIATWIPAARLVVMPDTGHLPALERPAQTLAMLEPHLADARRS
jgi:pimeloyl-ACP methyl ester carboxylesterase